MLKRPSFLVVGMLAGLVALTGPGVVAAAPAVTQTTDAERAARQRELEAERRERDRVRAEQQRERDRERAEAQRERDREQAEAQREREAEQRERQHEQAQNRGRREGRGVVVDGEKVVQNFRVGDAGSLRVNNLAGDIIVSGGSGGEILVETIKHARGATESEARQQLGNVDSSYQKVGNRVEIETNHVRNSRAWVDYTISVPAGTAVELRSVSGDIRISNVKGEVRAESVSGDIGATTLARAVSLKSVSGDVEVTSISADGELTLSSVSGDVVAKTLKGRSAAIGTVSGDVALKECVFSQASVQSVSGSIGYVGRLEKSGRYEFKTHSGDVSLASNEGFDLDASTFSGSLRSDVPLVTRGGDVNFERGRGPGRWVKAVAGSGGAFVEIKTFSGDIVLTKGQ